MNLDFIFRSLTSRRDCIRRVRNQTKGGCFLKLRRAGQQGRQGRRPREERPTGGTSLSESNTQDQGFGKYAFRTVQLLSHP